LIRSLQVDGVLDLHEFHVWQLSDTKLIASVHVVVRPEQNYMNIARIIKDLLHVHGIHSTTVQPEVWRYSDSHFSHPDGQSTKATSPNEMSDSACLLQCQETCVENVCCPPSAVPLGEVVTESGESLAPQVTNRRS